MPAAKRVTPTVATRRAAAPSAARARRPAMRRAGGRPGRWLRRCHMFCTSSGVSSGSPAALRTMPAVNASSAQKVLVAGSAAAPVSRATPQVMGAMRSSAGRRLAALRKAYRGLAGRRANAPVATATAYSGSPTAVIAMVNGDSARSPANQCRWPRLSCSDPPRADSQPPIPIAAPTAATAPVSTALTTWVWRASAPSRRRAASRRSRVAADNLADAARKMPRGMRTNTAMPTGTSTAGRSTCSAEPVQETPRCRICVPNRATHCALPARSASPAGTPM